MLRKMGCCDWAILDLMSTLQAKRGHEIAMAKMSSGMERGGHHSERKGANTAEQGRHAEQSKVTDGHSGPLIVLVN